MSEDNRDYVREAYECFIKNVEGICPTDPVAAIDAYFQKTASDELKDKCKEDGKTPAKAWRFIEDVARLALNGRSGHVDPTAVYAIAMHYFQDVPADWCGSRNNQTSPVKSEEPAKDPAPKKPKKPKKDKPKKPKDEQGFFFDLIEKGADDAPAQS